MGGQTPTNASDNTDYPIPKDRYGDPITYDGNPACLAGVMHDINKWIERTGNYKLLFEQYAVPLSNGALAIDQPDNIMFIEQRLPNAEEHGFFNPCPPTLKRIAQYNIKAVSSTPRMTTATPTKDPVPKEQSRNYVASAHKVEEQLRKLMCSMAHVFTDRDAAHAIIDKCAGNGSLYIWHLRSCTQTAPTHRQGQSFSQRLGRYLPRPLHRLSRLLGSVGPRNRSQSSLVQRRGR